MEELNVTGEVKVETRIGREAARKVMEAFGPELVGGDLVVRLEAVLEAVGGQDWQFASRSMFRCAKPTLAGWGVTYEYMPSPEGMLVYFKVDSQALADLEELAEEVGPALLGGEEAVMPSWTVARLYRLEGLACGIGLVMESGWVYSVDPDRLVDYLYAPIDGYVDDDRSWNYDEE